jgi:PAS domain S-box-containing protein
MSAWSPSAIAGMEQVVAQMPAAVLVVEAASGAIIHANAQARDMTERRLGRSLPPELTADWEIFHPDGRPYTMGDWPLMRSITSGENVVDEEYFNVLADGSRMIVRSSSSPIYDDDGSIVAGVLVMTDVTEQKRQEERLAYLAGLLDTTEDAIVALDADWFVTVWNKGAERMYGWTADEVVGRHTLEVARLGMSDEERAEARRAVAEHGRRRNEVVAYRKDGTPISVEAITVALRRADGQITGYLGIHRDISERKRVDEALREAQRQSETILESITDAFIAVDREWRYVYVNERGLRRLEAWKGRGLTREEILGKSMWELFPDLLGTEMEHSLRDAMDAQDPVEFELHFAPTGEWVEGVASPSPAGLSIYYRNVTNRRQAEEALREAQRRSETILESISDTFFAIDSEWRYTYVNERAVAKTRSAWGRDVTAEELLGKSCWELFPEQVGTTLYHELHRALREQTVVEFETFSTPTRTWVAIRAYPSGDGLSVYSRDISERKWAQEEMNRRADQQALVADLGQRALASDDLQSLLDEAVRLVPRTLGVELAKVGELLASGEELLIRAGAGWRTGIVGSATEPVGEGSQAGYALACDRAIVAEDLATERRFAPSRVVREHGAASAATVVIRGRDEPFGVLGALSTRRRRFSQSDVSFMQAVANVLATAVERRQAQQRLIQVKEVERRRIARDLHDEALQDVSHALVLAGLHAGTTGGSPEATDELTQALKRIGQQLRGAIYDLRLGGEERTPFPELLEALVAVHRARTVDTETELDVGEGVPAGPLGTTGIEVLRILGEALTNARRHASARRVAVRVWGSEGTLYAEVSDDGRGFDASGSAHVEWHGTRGMRERADRLHGRLDVSSDPAAGTTVRLEVPLRPDHNGAVERARVLLVEDHTAVREAIAAAFERDAGFDIVGQAASLADARGLLEDVDVAVLDLGLPDGSGADLIESLHEVSPGAQALVLSAALDQAEIARAIQSGAAGILDKTARLDDVVDAVRRLRAGETLLPLHEVVELLRFAERQTDQERQDREGIAALTPRERQVVQALGEGLDSQQIADRMRITIRTERNHVANILTKLGVHSQLQAVLVALRYGAIELS